MSDPAGGPATTVPSLKGSFTMAFGTPVVAYQWPESDALNAELRTVILEAEHKSRGLQRSNIGGWHSTNDFFTFNIPCVRTLRDRAQQLTIELSRAVIVVKDKPRKFGFRVEAWANVLREGGYNGVHDHPNSVWSGTYYVASGEPRETHPNNGMLELLDPRNGVTMVHISDTVLGARYTVDPKPGLMVLFPSWLRHFVHPFFGSGERISVAFNMLGIEQREPG